MYWYVICAFILGQAGDPLYVLLSCWLAAVGAGLVKSEDILEGVARLRISNDIEFEEENFLAIMNDAKEVSSLCTFMSPNFSAMIIFPSVVVWAHDFQVENHRFTSSMHTFVCIVFFINSCTLLWNLSSLTLYLVLYQGRISTEELMSCTWKPNLKKWYDK